MAFIFIINFQLFIYCQFSFSVLPNDNKYQGYQIKIQGLWVFNYLGHIEVVAHCLHFLY